MKPGRVNPGPMDFLQVSPPVTPGRVRGCTDEAISRAHPRQTLHPECSSSPSRRPQKKHPGFRPLTTTKSPSRKNSTSSPGKRPEAVIARGGMRRRPPRPSLAKMPLRETDLQRRPAGASRSFSRHLTHTPLPRRCTTPSRLPQNTHLGR